MKKKVIAIDIVTLYSGFGGSGGGIWTYAQNLLINLDNQIGSSDNFELYCFVNTDYQTSLKNIKIIKIKGTYSGLFNRLFYIHVILPILCYKHKVDYLHKLATEIPIFCFSKILLTIHDFMAEHYKENLDLKSNNKVELLKQSYFLFMTKFAIRNSFLIFTPSISVKNEAVFRYSIDPKKVHAIQLASIPDNSLINITEKKRFNIYYIAVFLPHKGHLKAIKIFEYLKKNYDLSAKLIFRGGKVNKAYYESVINEINKLDISFDIKIEEFDRTANLNQIYDQADVIMLLSTYEGFGLPVLEAQTRGIPVICSNIPVFQEITNLSAILVNPENLEQTCNRIYALSKDKKIYNYYSEQGIINSKRFSWITFASSFYNVYKNLN